MTEDQAWDEQQMLHDIHERNKAHMAAMEATGLFVIENDKSLGDMTLRQAYEKGFIDGFKKGRESK